MSVEESQGHETFICEYKVRGNSINSVGIKTVFAERKFWREDNIWLKKEINCCQSQLVIVSTQPFSTEYTGYGISWKIQGFKAPGTYLVYKEYNGIVFPDSIPIFVVKIKNKDTSQVIETLTLDRVKK
ncbi:hypothetical protein [Mucilaginibacter jinjuensis]|uniref:Uncharacterized protein n=1 Tax=Mucilaginibacter jinjuensis TaxID=1176721 RepID=A0ABY7TB31_9SPHI|nr:hypothetical protein [Mucilaginibacter jinjuensis]WCT13651.1 hypothetical protein PQO05_06845 [Mucilaginibacter jinjuensis]